MISTLTKCNVLIQERSLRNERVFDSFGYAQPFEIELLLSHSSKTLRILFINVYFQCNNIKSIDRSDLTNIVPVGV